MHEEAPRTWRPDVFAAFVDAVEAPGRPGAAGGEGA
jgi:hypothetical protein